MKITPSDQATPDKKEEKKLDSGSLDRAVALKYYESAEIPKILAHGYGSLAQTIIDLANKHGIPVHSDPALAALLLDTEIDASISQEAQRLLAEVISFLYQTDREATPPQGPDLKSS